MYCLLAINIISDDLLGSLYELSFDQALLISSNGTELKLEGPNGIGLVCC